MTDDLVVAEGLVKRYPVRGRGVLTAVDGVGLRIERGTTLALVGESGCGKSTTGGLLLALERPDEGRMGVAGRELYELGRRELRTLRRAMQPVFQDPYDSLNARMTVERIVAEAAAPRRRVCERAAAVTALGEPPSTLGGHTGCAFAPRCPLATGRCRTEDPALRALPGTGRKAACHYAETAQAGAA
jgi:ABC-type glutathione transport system ATPase component